MAAISAKLLKWQRKLTFLEWAVIIAIVTVIAALILPAAKWAASGEITTPVQVLVFDPTTQQPVVGARVVILRYPHVFGLEDIHETHQLLADVPRHATDAAGLVTIEQRFSTGAGYQRPIPHAHVSGVWLIAEAAGYGRVLVPVRYESMPSAELRNRGKLFVPVALLPNPGS